MRIALSLLLAVLALTAFGVAAQNPTITDLQAFALVQQSDALLARNDSRGAANATDRRLIDARLAEIARLQAQAERGNARLSPATRRALDRAFEALQSIPVEVLVDARAPAALTTISGTITASAGGASLQNVAVSAREFSLGSSPSGAGISAFANTNAAGQYTLTLPPGNYVVRASAGTSTTPASTTGYQPRVYDDLACNPGSDCPGYFGTVVPLTSGAPASGINLALPVGARISGTVTRQSDGTPVTSGFVIAESESGSHSYSTSVGAGGIYTIIGMAPGNYRVWVDSQLPGLMSEARGNLPCSPLGDCSWLPSPLLPVSAGSTTSGINFALDAAGKLSGVVQDGAGAPIANAALQLYSEDGYSLLYATSDASGEYSFTGLRSGSYRLVASAPSSDPVTFQPISIAYAPVAYPATDCPYFGCNPLTAGTSIAFVAPDSQILPAITLPALGTISGHIRDAATNAPLQGINVSASAPSGLGYSSGITDAAGNYTMRGLPADSYYVVADARAQNYVLTYNGNAVCPGNFCDRHGVPVTLAASGPGSSGTANIDLPRGGRISGRITDAAVSAPASANRVRLEVFGATTARYVDIGFQRCDPPTASAPPVCSYEVTGLAPGTYKGSFASSTLLGMQDTAFGGSPCPRGGCDQSALPPLFATTGSTLAGIDVSMPRGAIVRGRITDASTGSSPDCRAVDLFSFTGLNNLAPCGGVGVNNQLDNYAGFGIVGRDGRYFTRTGFASGTTLYVSTFLLRNNFSYGFGYVDQAYSGVSCPYGSCGITTGTGITVGAADTTGIDMALVRGGVIAGQITAASGGAPIAAVEISAFNGAGRQVALSRSDTQGRYRLTGLPSGSYFVSTRNQRGYLDEVYNDVACDPFCNPLTGTSVAVSGTATTAAIDFALDLSASISGTVRLGGSPVTNVPVELYGAIGNLLRSVVSSAGGSYVFSGLPAGRYYVRTRDTMGSADALFNGLPCVGNACLVRSGTPINLAPPGTSSATANLDLASPGSISGTVTAASGGAPISGVTLQLLVPSGAVALTRTTNGSGAFTFNGLAAGSYRMVTRGTPGYIDVAFPAVPCSAACNGLNGTAIAVAAGASVTGRNFALGTGGSISGSVRAGPSAPVVGATVQVYNNSGIPVGQISTNASGNYQVDILPAGNFFVRTQQSLGFVDQVFNAMPCSGYCDLLSGTPVGVSAGMGTGLVDFSLTGGSSISGRVSNSATAAGIALARVVAFDTGGFIAGQAQANASGDYTIAGLRPGTYRLRTANLSGFVNEVHAGIGCTPMPCNVLSGTPITLAAAPVSGINFALDPGGSISGTAGDTFNNPLPTGTALLLDSTGGDVAMTPITNGVWEFNGLANGTYYVLIRNTSGLVDQLFANVPCPAGACNVTALGTPIVLNVRSPSGTGTANINLRLPVGQTIAGTVRGNNNQPLNGVTVFFFDSTGAPSGQAVTDGLGQYISEGSLPSGTYYAATANGLRRGAGQGYVNRLYNGQNCLLDCAVTAGTGIALGGSPATGIDFNLGTAGVGISGTVRNAGGQAIPLVRIEIYDSNGVLAGLAQTNSLGMYSVDGLPAGNYFARTSNNLGLQDRLFGGSECGANCNPLAGTAIVVPQQAGIANIDFVLAPRELLFANGFE